MRAGTTSSSCTRRVNRCVVCALLWCGALLLKLCLSKRRLVSSHCLQVTKRARDMMAARYYRRMKHAHRGPGPFDPKKIPAFNASKASLPEFPEQIDGRNVR